MEIFYNYIKGLKQFNLNEITEHSHRKTLQELLESVFSSINKKIKILHEPKRNKGLSPDFKVTFNNSIIGYVENKGIEEDLHKVLKSEQISKYLELSDNILLTNYIDWVWIKDKKRHIISLCSIEDLEKRNFKLNEENVNDVFKLISSFFSQPPLGISKPKDLAIALAIRGKWLKDFLQEELHRQEREHQSGKLFGLYDTFKNNIHSELTLDNFADAFSQTLVYGLFLAKLNSANENNPEEISLYNAKKYIPVSFELIKELLDFIDELEKEDYKDIRWIVEEVLSIMNNLNLDDLLLSLSYKKWNKKGDSDNFLKDPYVYFYEDFLSAYDKKLRKAKGVYYTPPPVVNFIIRAIDDLLVDRFNIKDGLADREKVTVLDFATGTGTFLLEIFKNIFEKLPPKSGKQNLIIKEHILKNLYGFEYLIAPYTIAHLKLSQFLIDNGYIFDNNERLQIYLANTLEPVSPSYNAFIPALSEESKLAKDVKEKPILVITGNPPYSGHSQNPSWKIKKSYKNNKEVSKKVLTWIGEQIEKYKFVDSKPLGEKNPKWLQDDYVKFIRFAQHKMEEVDEGIVGIITNHSFLDNPTFRGMRQSLMNTFDEMYFLDLHGNAKKKEKTPDGGKDENVFDIEQGVCISILIKNNKSSDSHQCKIYHSDFWGLREEKYKNCVIYNFKDVIWEELKPQLPFYFFVSYDDSLKLNYDKGISLKDIFELNSVGIVTARDNFTIHNYPEQVKNTIAKFLSMDDEEARIHFNLGKDTRDWKIVYAKNDLLRSNKNENSIVRIAYRPFDIRWTYYTGKSKGFHCMPRGEVMQHMLKSNIAIISVRQVAEGIFNHCFVTNNIIESRMTLSNKGIGYLFPLYRYLKSSNNLFESSNKIENFKKEFRNYIFSKYKYNFTSEEVFGYIYSILHSPDYRKKYSDFLKTDFPRITLTDDINTFRKLSSLGWELAQVHLMNKEYLNKLPKSKLGNYTGTGNNEVIKPEYIYNNKTKYGRLKINPAQYFDNVPEEIYNFYIGGYQVLDKYLKDRKSRTLTLDEIENVENIVKIIYFTISQMNKISTLTKEWT